MNNDTKAILSALKKIERSMKEPASLPSLDVFHSVSAAVENTPSRHRAPMSVPVIGELGHMKKSVYGKIFRWLNIDLVSESETTPASRLGFIWKPWILGSDYRIEPTISEVRRVSPDIQLVNETSFDDDKAVVQKLFHRRFGYALEIDPRVHTGPVVAKSRQNAIHDGQIVECPLHDADADLVYQVVVDNAVAGDLVEDLRIVIVNYAPILCYMKYRAISKRFSNDNIYARLAGVLDVCSTVELDWIAGLARDLGLEVGELDALRDRSTGLLYVVDANNTPYGPPNNIEARDGDIAVRWVADAFARAYLV